jgi:hypothetical protein
MDRVSFERIYAASESTSFLAKIYQVAHPCESAYASTLNAGATSMCSLVDPTPFLSLRAEYILGPTYVCYSLCVDTILT